MIQPSGQREGSEPSSSIVAGEKVDLLGVDWFQMVPGFSVVSVEMPRNHKSFVLTYDDGPDPVATRDVLDALDAFGATATFFVLLTRAQRMPELVREIVDRGHEIGLHGKNHRRPSFSVQDDLRGQLEFAKMRLEEISSQDVRWFRPPYGDQTTESWWATVRSGLIPVMWMAEARDWEDVPLRSRIESVSRLRQAGEILVCHDGYPDKSDGVVLGSPPPYFDRGEFSRSVLQTLRDRGLEACSLSSALASGIASGRIWLNR